MNTYYLIILLIVLCFVIAVQLIRFSGYIIRMTKTKELHAEEVKADKEWEFIKGLY